MTHDRQIRVFVLIDALGWTNVQGRHFLDDLLPFRTPLRSVLGFSSGAIPTILTGVPPAENGHWNLFYYDPTGSPFRWLKCFRFLPDKAVNHRISRKIMKEVGRRFLGLGRQFECCVSPRLLPWFNWIEKRNIYERGGISGASSIFDQLADRRVPYRVYSYHELRDEEIFRQAKEDLQSGETDFFFVYLSELDEFLHLHCVDANRLGLRLDWYAAQLRELFTIARRQDPEAALAVFSDHGMAPVHHHYELVREIEALGFSIPNDYLAVYDSTMARFWFFNDRAQMEIAERLADTPCGRIIPDTELEALGVLFPDRRYGELIFLLNPGWLVSRSDFNGPRWMPSGMHGYHPDDPYSDAVFLSSQPPKTKMQTIADVYTYMREASLARI